MRHWMTASLIFWGALAFAHEGHENPAHTHLKFNNGGIHAHVSWQRGPHTPDESSFRVDWKQGSDHSPLNPTEGFEVSVFMPSMGHGSAPVRIEAATDSAGRSILGSFIVSKIYLMMDGQWDISVTLKTDGGKKSETQKFSVQVKSGSHQHSEPPKTSLNSQALRAICADGVTAHPKWPGFWHIDRPNFARSADTLFATMHLRPNATGEYAVVKVDLANPSQFTEVTRFQEPIRDLEFHNGQVWVLFRQKLVALNPDNGQKTAEAVTSWETLSEDQAAFSFAWQGERLVIAHGSKGMMIYDPAAQGITQAHGLGLTSGGLVLKAIDVVALSDSQVAFAIENVSVSNDPPFPFNGILLMDKSGSIERYPYNRKSSGSLSNARLQVAGGVLLINNWGILHSVKIADMKRAGQINVNWTPIHFDVNGARRPGELLGDLMIDSGQVVSCAQTDYQDPDTRKVIHLGVVYAQPVPSN